MKIEIKMSETVEEIIDRIVKEEGAFSYEYATVTNGDNVARVLIGGDMLNMDVHGAWNHKGAKYLHIYFDVYFSDDDVAKTCWVEDYNSVIAAFEDAMTGAIGGI